MDKDLLKLQKSYMETICEEQIMHLLEVNICCVIYGVFAYIFFSDKIFTDVIHGHSEYKAFLMVAIFMLAYLAIGNFLIKKEDVSKRSLFARIGIDFCSAGYLCWAGMAIYYSIIEGRNINFMVWLMVMGLAVSTFFFGLTDFIIIYLVNTGFALTILYIFFNGEINKSSSINLGVFTIMFAVIYITKHFSELKSYKTMLHAKQIEDAKKLFTASMNHELRTPLNSIIGNAQIMLSKKDLSEDDRETVENIFGSSKTMVQLVNDLLDYSKLESGEFKIIPAEFDLCDLKSNIEGMMTNLAKEKGLEFEVTIDENTPVLMIGDMRRIQQIVVNIASNGIKYTKTGKVKVSFTFWQNSLHIKVKDTGMGMTKETIEDMFNPFNRGDEGAVSNIQGTGLGMFIVKNLLNQMNGSIEISSEIDVGTVVRVDVPVEVKDLKVVYKHEEEEEHELEVQKEIPEGDLTGKIILSVDDTVMNNRIIQNFLDGTGATVYSMLDAERCLKFLSTQKADLIIMDHLMPGMDGVECLKRIRAFEDERKDIPVIMLTGNGDEECKKLYEDSGASGYLLKPVMRDKLIKNIGDILRKK